ncbi:hypothetical protein [Candidatus Phyllobacterium onerii]|uniref:hypothetical protein n=1 Tax=Candidatus Phyllobacterium onerii TaxID=3020828 RepID=UPI00232FD330|nr:hypothetical protein [Phyllobacterium sp. IY22]
MTQRMVDSTGAVEIPDEPTMFHSIVPPVLIPLPLRARPHKGKNIFFGLLSSLIGPILVVGALLLAFAVFDGSFPARDIILFIVFGPISFLGGIGFTGVALTCIIDAMRKNPVLVIDAEGFRDTRSGVRIKWSAIRRATLLFTRSGIAGVDLHLRGSMEAWQNPFRIGVLGFRWRPKPDHLILSVAFLDARPHILAYTVLALTQRQGGEVATKTSFVDLGLTPITPTKL